MRLAQGPRLGHYEVISPLGKGGVGEVYLAQDVRLGRRVALKVLPAADRRVARCHQVVVADLASACSLAGATGEAIAILDRLVDLQRPPERIHGHEERYDDVVR